MDIGFGEHFATDWIAAWNAHDLEKVRATGSRRRCFISAPTEKSPRRSPITPLNTGIHK